MLNSIYAAVALAINPSPTVMMDQWSQATRYDTMISLFPMMPTTSASFQKNSNSQIFFASETEVLLKFDRGSSGGFDLSSLIYSPIYNSTSMQLVTELRQLSGLTWQQLADLLKVKPRTLHNWSAGHVIAEKNLRKLGEVLAILRHIDTGYSEANRDILLNRSIDGRTVFSLIEEGEFDQVKLNVGQGIGRSKPRPALSSAKREKWGVANFGIEFSAIADDADAEISLSKRVGKRPTQARRKI